jgi:hypothetical protein
MTDKIHEHHVTVTFEVYRLHSCTSFPKTQNFCRIHINCLLKSFGPKGGDINHVSYITKRKKQQCNHLCLQNFSPCTTLWKRKLFVVTCFFIAYDTDSSMIENSGAHRQWAHHQGPRRAARPRPPRFR